MKRLLCNKGMFMMASSLYAVGVLCGDFAYAGGLPSNGKVVDGHVHIQYRGDTLDIDQSSDKAVIDWDSFSVGKGNTVNFNQPSSSSATLNRVTGDFTSEIAGRINANGSVFLVNPNGFMITKDGVIDTGSFVASTLDIDTQDFLNGDYTFTKSKKSGIVDNQGNISVDDGGFVALLGGAVKNDGTVRALVGKVGFAGGEKIVMSFGNSDFLRVEVPTDKWEQLTDSQGNKVSATLDLGGEIDARGGFIDITVADASDILRQTISIDGIVSANTVSSKDGVISISGGTVGITGTARITADADYADAGQITIDAQSLNVSAAVSAAAATGKGGTVKVSLQQGASLNRGAVFDVSGKQGGRLSFIGGLSGDKVYKIVGTGDFIADGSTGTGGYIDISNKNGLVGLFSGTVSAQGAVEGGRIRIGGAFQGGAYDPKTSSLDNKTQHLFVTRWADTPSIVSAAKVSLGTGVNIDVSSASGTGGTAILWADHTTNNYAQITATGNTGGAVEISAKKKVDSFGLKRLAVGNGVILLDPKNVIIGKFVDGLSQAKRIMSTTPLAGFTFDLDNNDNFGTSVALSGDGSRLAVGARFDDTGASNNGAVYLFTVEGTGSEWGSALQQQYKIAYGSGLNVKRGGAKFGQSVAFNDDGTKLAVGMPLAHKANSAYGVGYGRVFLFSIDGKDWGTSVTRNSYVEYGGNGFFGASVALSNDGTKLAVGETGGSSGGQSHVGSVSLFTLSGSGSNWGTPSNRNRTVRLSHNLGGASISLSYGDAFGFSVSLSGDGSKLAVGAEGDDTGKTDAGAVYLFTVGGASWGTSVTKTNKITDGDAGLSLNTRSFFGEGVALSDDGSKLAVGSIFDTNNLGRVYLFTVGGSTWGNTVTSAGVIKNKSGVSLSGTTKFGYSIALSADGSQLAVGAPDDSTGGSKRGAVYLFRLSPSSWGSKVHMQQLVSHQQMLDLSAGEEFGSSVALSGDGTKLAVGAIKYNSKGAVYLFEINPHKSTWGHNVLYTRRISDNDGVGALDSGADFGYSVALSNDGTKLAVGANDTDSGKGAVYLLTVGGSRWGNTITETKQIISGVGGLSLDANDYFGTSVALSDDGSKLAVGAWGDDDVASNAGAVYLFTLSGSTWGSTVTKRQKVKNIVGSSLSAYDRFGESVALDAGGYRLAVGSSGDDTGAGKTNTGAVRVIVLGGFYWGQAFSLEAKIADGSGVSLSTSDEFGISVSLSGNGNRLAVGARGDDTGGSDRGAVHLFTVNNSGTATNTGKIAHEADVFLANYDNFGWAVALNGDGDKLAVGSRYDDTSANNAGAVHLFTVGGSSWGNTVSHSGKVFEKQNFSLGDTERFGNAVALSDDGTKMAVGAGLNDTGGSNRGAVYLFELSGGDRFGQNIYHTATVAHDKGVSLSDDDRFGTAVALKC